MSNNLNKVIENLIASNNESRRKIVREASIVATLSDDTKDFLVAQRKFEASIDGGKFGFTNGNSAEQNDSNEKVLAGIPLSEQ